MGQNTSAPSPATPVEPYPVGCEVLFEGVAPITADVVFVHGLCGHRTETWTKNGMCWPRDLLSKENALSHVRVLTFGYDANINPGSPTSLNSLFEHSINLVNELNRERRRDSRDRPLIFVAHSLGGLIVKDALDYSDKVRDTKPDLARIVSATRGIIFLGTPHRGSGATSLAKVVASVTRVVLKNIDHNLIRDIETNSQTLDRIRDSFRRVLERRTWTVWSFTEELPMMGTEKVVYGDSAIIDYSREYRETIHADHIGMTKFSSKSDPGYKKVLYAIEVLLEGPSEGERAEAPRKDMGIYVANANQIIHVGSVTGGAGGSSGGHGGGVYIGNQKPSAFDFSKPHFAGEAPHNFGEREDERVMRDQSTTSTVQPS